MFECALVPEVSISHMLREPSKRTLKFKLISVLSLNELRSQKAIKAVALVWFRNISQQHLKDNQRHAFHSAYSCPAVCHSDVLIFIYLLFKLKSLLTQKESCYGSWQAHCPWDMDNYSKHLKNSPMAVLQLFNMKFLTDTRRERL